MSSTMRRVAIIVGGLAIIAIAVYVATKPDHSFYVKAEFKDAGQLRKSSSVKIGGVPAGKVSDLVITKRDTAIATLRINKSALPLGKDMKVNVRPTDLLGERYADVDPGNIKDPIKRGGFVSLKNTVEPVELDDIFNIYDPGTRGKLGILLNELGTSLEGRGKNLNTLLGVLPLTLQQVRGLVKQVSDENVALKDSITRGDRILAAVDNKRDDLGGLIDEANGALNTVAEKRRDLGSTISNAPGALTQLRSTLGNLDAASIALRPTSKLVQQTAGPLKSTLSELPDFAKEADPTLKTGTKVAPQLSHLGKDGTPTVRHLWGTAKDIQSLLVPAKAALAHMERRGTNDVLYFVSNFQKLLAATDQTSHLIGADLFLNFSSIAQAINGFNGTKSEQPSARDKKQEDAKAAVPDTGDKSVDDATKKVDDKVGDLTKKVQDTVKKTTDTAKHVVDNTKQTVDQTAGAVTTAVQGITQKVTQGGQGQQGQQKSSSTGGDAQTLFNYLMGP